ncbi:sugar ABC transporter ATP-binding protein [Oceanobacillus picturae]|uniref:Sugar ABC transporter ATP-binding protein n=2 Tax=Oceanobacillus picturae TaxID=171693 RepID=A0A0U9HB80_9BACI|nr:sugar ABC transporter ATP-binding protein [Oceanobacillus picturae]
MTTMIEGLVKRFGQTTALKKIDIEIQDGEFIAILDPSGCGKTTLLRLFSWLRFPNRRKYYNWGETGEQQACHPPARETKYRDGVPIIPYGHI